MKIKNRVIAFLLFSFLAGTIITSCKKYEDGPALSLATKKSRITGDWKIENITYDGEDVTAFYLLFLGNGVFISINKDQSYMIETDKGTWSFSGDKESLILDPEDAKDETTVHKILRLTKKELWLQDTDADNKITVMKLRQ